MATLPDLDTSNLGYVAFWNFKDNMVSSFDPATALSAPRIGSYTLYDNGWEGQMEIPTWFISVDVSNPTATVRVKNDGWIVVYTGRTNEYGDTGEAHGQFDKTDPNEPNWPKGYYNIAYGVDEGSSVSTPYRNSLQRTIYNVASELDNWQSNDWNYSDVGLYNYEYTGASATTIVGHEYNKYSIGFTSGTNILYASTIFYGSEFKVNGSSQINVDYTVWPYNFLANGLLDQTEKEYQMELDANHAITSMWS